jgi:hypothetical protein
MFQKIVNSMKNRHLKHMAIPIYQHFQIYAAKFLFMQRTVFLSYTPTSSFKQITLMKIIKLFYSPIHR